MNLRYLAILCVATLALSSCEDDTVSGTVVGPLTGPRIAESQLALDVVDGAPVGITDIFELGEFVNLWIHWEKLQPPHRVDVEWFDPLGASFATGVDLEERASEQVTVFTLDLSGLSATGRWEVAVYLDDEFMRSHTFLVVSSIVSP